MDPIAIAAALYDVEDDNDRMRSSVELFWALFRDDLTEAEREKLSFDPEAAIGDLDNRLREITEGLKPRYAIDEPDDPKALFITAHLQASRLVFYLLQCAAGRNDRFFGYGEDAGLYVRCLEKLIVRLRRSMPRRGSPHEFPEVFQMSISTIESLAERVEAELAAQRGDYEEALARLVNSLTCAAFVGEINEAWEHSENPEELVDLAQACPWRTFQGMVNSDTWFAWTLPWLPGADLSEQKAARWFEHLKEQPNKHDWGKLARTFDGLAEGFIGRADVEPEDVEVDGWNWYIYWQRAESWAEAQLTTNELRDLRRAKEEDAAETRLREYFFNEAHWNVLSDRAKGALVSADTARVSSKYKAPVLDGLRVAMADILYGGLWIPIGEWAKEQPPEKLRVLKDIQKRLDERRHEPKLADYNQLLSAPECKEHLQSRDIGDDDINFIIDKNLRNWCNRLLATRNSAVYKPTAKSDRGEVHKIYAEFMGLGRDRRAILPELVRILSQSSP